MALAGEIGASFAKADVTDEAQVQAAVEAAGELRLAVSCALANEPPISPARASPRSSFTSAIVTRAPREASSRAVASPSPDAPPATSAPAPFSSMAAAEYWPALQGFAKPPIEGL